MSVISVVGDVSNIKGDASKIKNETRQSSKVKTANKCSFAM